MALTPAEFKVRFPEFVLIPDARIQLFIDDATNVLSEPVWTACYLYEIGVCYLAAHYLKLGLESEEGGGSISGPLSMQKVGDVSVTYQTFTINDLTTLDVYYESTIYGRRFLIEMRKVGIGAVIVC